MKAETGSESFNIDICVEKATPNDSPDPQNLPERAESQSTLAKAAEDKEKLDINNLVDFDMDNNKDTKENVEMVTIKDGQILSVQTEDQGLLTGYIDVFSKILSLIMSNETLTLSPTNPGFYVSAVQVS